MIFLTKKILQKQEETKIIIGNDYEVFYGYPLNEVVRPVGQHINQIRNLHVSHLPRSLPIIDAESSHALSLAVRRIIMADFDIVDRTKEPYRIK